MPKGFARVAAASLPVHLGDVAANEQEILSAMEPLRRQGVQLAVFPELCLTGYTLGDLLLQPLVQAASWESMLRIAEKTDSSMAVVIGLPVNVRSRLYNCAAVLYGGRPIGFVPKTYLPNGNEFYETRWFVSGAEADETLSCTLPGGEVCSALLRPDQLFDLGGFTFGVEICEDLWTPIPPSCQLAVDGADVIVNPSASNALVSKHQYRRELLSQQSGRLYAGYAYAGAGFGESTSDLVFDGYTAVYESGRALSEGLRFQREGGTAIADIDVQRLRYQRQRNGSFHQMPAGKRKPAFVSDTPVAEAALPLIRRLDPLPFVPQGTDADGRLEEIVHIQMTGLMSRLASIHCKHLVVGVSGGLDSTLALLVAARAYDELGLDRSGIHAITMPGMGTGARTKSNADILMERLRVSSSEIARIKQASLGRKPLSSCR